MNAALVHEWDFFLLSFTIIYDGHLNTFFNLVRNPPRAWEKPPEVLRDTITKTVVKR